MVLHRAASIGKDGPVPLPFASAPAPGEAPLLRLARAWRNRTRVTHSPSRCLQPDYATWLAPTRIRCRQPIASRKRALEHCAALLAADLPTRPRRRILDALIARERLGSTALDNGVALPHARIRGLDAPMAACITLAAPVDFDAPDRQRIDVVFCVLLPDESDREPMRALAATLSRADVAAALRVQTGPAGVRARLEQPPTRTRPVNGDRVPRSPGVCVRERRAPASAPDRGTRARNPITSPRQAA